MSDEQRQIDLLRKTLDYLIIALHDDGKLYESEYDFLQQLLQESEQ